MATRRSITVSDRIRAQMALNRLKVKDMTNLFKVSARTWENWMNDPETQLSIGKLRVIAAAVKTTPAALIGDDE